MNLRRTRSVVLALGLLTTAGPAFAETHLVAIGNNEGLPSEQALHHAERDATAFASVLVELGRVQPEHHLEVLGKDATTVRRILLKTNAHLRGAQAEGARDQILLVYYSGHADASGLHLGSTQLSYEELKAIVESSPAKVRILIIDSCSSGGITRLKGGRPAAPFNVGLDDRLEAEGMAIITSSSDSEDSQESDLLGGSFFTHHLVTALRGAGDSDRDTRVTMTEAYAYAYQQTVRSSGTTTQLQHPTYLYDLKGQGGVPLTFLGADRGRSAVLVLPEPGRYLVFAGDPSGAAFAEVVVADGGAELVVPPARYTIQRRDVDSYRRYQLELPSAGKIDLSKQPYDELKYARLLRKGGGGRGVVHNLRLGGITNGPFLDGQRWGGGVLGSYSAELSWLSLGVGLRWGQSGLDSTAPELTIHQHQLALRLSGEHFFDLEALSIGAGVLIEGGPILQRFEARAPIPTRTTWGLGFGISLALERELFEPWFVRLDGGPLTQLFRVADIEAGSAQGGSRVEPSLSWWAALALGWRL